LKFQKGNTVTLTVENPKAIAEIKELMSRFGLPADVVVERLVLEAGCWMPMELLATPKSA
jgi:hypothetical protein